MVYGFVKVLIRVSLLFFAKRVRFSHRLALGEKGPLLLACNHPNSFLDAVMLGAYMQQPVHFITRGDVFKNPKVRRILESLHMIPIYRIRDGKDKLAQNDEAFAKSMEVLRGNGVLLIFVEGFCINQTELQRPLKKGAPRILQACWQEGVPARVLPVWLEYTPFNRIGKTIDVRFGQRFGQDNVDGGSPAAQLLKINAETERQLLALSQDLPPVKPTPQLFRLLLALPALLGAVLHAPLFLPVTALVKKLNNGDVHYDAMMLAILTFLYPVYLILFTSIVYLASGATGVWWLLLAMPALAQAYIWWRR